MEIRKGNFKFRGSLQPLDLQKVNSIALHHMDHLTANEYEVEKWHLQNSTNSVPWLGFAYNYWIGFDGRIIEGRGLNQGAGVEGHNNHILSIGFQGNYNVSNSMPKQQYDAGVWLIDYLKKLLNKDLVVDGHNRWNPTSCPGKYFPLSKIITDKPTKIKIMAMEKPIEVIVNGKKVEFDINPINKDGRILVPVRAIVEALGKSVEWDSVNNSVIIKDGVANEK
jgi:hypothetical protein